MPHRGAKESNEEKARCWGRKEKMEDERKAAREDGLLWVKSSMDLGSAGVNKRGALPATEASIS